MAQSPRLDPKLNDLCMIDIAELDEHECFLKFAEFRFGDLKSFPCPHCGVIGRHYLKKERKQWQCRERKICGRYFSATSGTILADRKLSFKKIMLALVKFVTSAKGNPNIEMAKDLRLSYKTSFVLFGKIRELLLRRPVTVPLEGTVHADGGYFAGRPRKPAKRRKPTPEEVEKRIATGKKTLSANDYRNLKRRQKRRVIIVFCESGGPGRGPGRTLTFIAKHEDQNSVTPMYPRVIARGSTLHTDESTAYADASLYVIHRTVEHAKEFVTDDGVSENDAENFFSRCRRAVLGVRHKIEPLYMADFAAEMAWRQNFRKSSSKAMIEDLFSLLRVDGLSRSFRGYWQGYHRTKELLQFVRSG